MRPGADILAEAKQGIGLAVQGGDDGNHLLAFADMAIDLMGDAGIVPGVAQDG